MRILDYRSVETSSRHAWRLWLLSREGDDCADAEALLRAAGFGPAPPRLGFPQPPDLILLASDEPLAALGQHIAWAKLRRPQAPLLLVTTLPSVERAVAAMRLGACDCLLLPLDPAEGARRLAAALPRPSPEPRLFRSGEVLRALAAAQAPASARA